MFFWQLGVLQYLEQNFDLARCTFVGSSAGSMLSVLAACDVGAQVGIFSSTIQLTSSSQIAHCRICTKASVQRHMLAVCLQASCCPLSAPWTIRVSAHARGCARIPKVMAVRASMHCVRCYPWGTSTTLFTIWIRRAQSLTSIHCMACGMPDNACRIHWVWPTNCAFSTTCLTAPWG
jgi:hypothetical protein